MTLKLPRQNAQHPKRQAAANRAEEIDPGGTDSAWKTASAPDIVGIQRLIGNRAVTRMLRPMPAPHAGSVQPNRIQRLITGYKAGKPIRNGTKVLRGLNSKQRAKIQQLHADTSVRYSVNKARKAAGADPLPASQTTFRRGLPFGFRYEKGGADTMETVSDLGGLVQYPLGGMPSGKNSTSSMSFSVGRESGSLPQGTKRKIGQTKIMDDVSPNKAARQLGFSFDSPKSWEWLHLVAFTIGQTHVTGLSADSVALIARTSQPQQIRENLVLGSSAANTEMLSYETKIRQILTENPGWKLNLAVMAAKEDRVVQNESGDSVTIPVATAIHYHFQFETAAKTYTPPVVVGFNPQSLSNPASESFDAVCKKLDAVVAQQVELKKPLKGISTTDMETV